MFMIPRCKWNAPRSHIGGLDDSMRLLTHMTKLTHAVRHGSHLVVACTNVIADVEECVEVMAEYLGATQFQVKAREHTIACDQPEENGGFNEGMTPPELLLASVGTCAGYYAAQYLKTRRLSVDGMRIRVTAEKTTVPARLSSFRIEVQIPAGLETRHRQGVLRAIQSCLIHNTLLNRPKIELEIVAPTIPDLAVADS